ncbi:hypothetical protein Hamer_G027305 [Homarus americanus]|uniref:Uncharacterized protein n=1 Tax=Homarus americanus TaxID=6706 RepID=A0A8J5MZL0_HOMAM|nr:hypothetical protein Hamer_G027305 [Homarus americanus]
MGLEIKADTPPSAQICSNTSPVEESLCTTMASVPLLHQWTKANALFKPPVINQCRTIELKLTKLWHKAVETSLGKGNLARKNEFLHTLDTLFDILTCKCSIQLCSESNCSHSGKRENNSHIDCGCPREKKIPVLELEFIKAQRTKAEGQGSMQMGSIDYSETKKQIANAKKREQIREREQKKKMKSEEAIQREEELCQDVYHFFDIPPINVNATKLSELVDLSLEVLEPPLTTSLTSQELRNLKETPMQVPKWPSHTQSVERCVKMVTEAAGHVYSHERREGAEIPPPFFLIRLDNPLIILVSSNHPSEHETIIIILSTIIIIIIIILSIIIIIIISIIIILSIIIIIIISIIIILSIIIIIIILSIIIIIVIIIIIIPTAAIIDLPLCRQLVTSLRLFNPQKTDAGNNHGQTLTRTKTRLT